MIGPVRVAVTLLLVALGAVSLTASAEAKKPVSLTVALQQDIDSMNPLVGVNVSSYEVWNLQYATLTDKAAKDFSTIPGLAESWKGSKDGLTWTYTLRANLKWSDGKPLTSDDVVFTINRAHKEEWLNYTSTLQNITANAKGPLQVVIHSTVRDPKLPTMDVYILPKHIWAKYDKDAITKYAALDGVGSGPFTLQHLEKGQFWRMQANPNYWNGRPAIDTIVFRRFNNADAMVAALTRGEIDAAHDVPSGGFKRLEKDKRFVTIQGEQGGFDELAVNGGAGLKKPHPALLDLRVRQAIADAINKRTIIDKVYRGLGSPLDTISPSASPEWIPQIPASERQTFDLAKANRILDAAGYKDTNGDGIREMPGGGRPLVLRYGVRSTSDVAAPIADYVSGWLRKIGIDVTRKTYSDSELTVVVGKGDYDLFQWGWTPFVDPDPMLSYFTCGQVSQDPKDPTNYYNDANWCDHTYDKLYGEQKVELDHAKRVQIVHEMLTRFYDAAVYNVLASSPDLQAYRAGRFTGWIRQPANIGPVLFSNTSPTYANLRPSTAGAGGGGGLGTGSIVGIAVGAAVLLALAALWALRRRTSYERE
jgi:peptide/nickel transport system substrate-binding protein